MKKDCFAQDLVDAKKFRECATCHLFEECTRTVALQGAMKADFVGQGLAYVLVVVGLALAVTTWGDMPHGSPWLAFMALVFGLSVYRAGRETKQRNQEEREYMARQAEAKPESGPAPAAHH